MEDTKLLREYDRLVTSLQTQQELYTADNSKLHGEILRLVSDNEELRELVEDLFRNRLQPQDFASVVSNEMVGNLRSQLQVNMQERSQLCDLLQEAQRQIRQSVTTFSSKNFDEAMHSLSSKMENVQLELKMERSSREEEQAQRLKAQTELARVRIVLDEKVREEQRLQERVAELNKQCSGWEQENIVLTATSECITQSRDALETELTASLAKVEWLKTACDEARNKVEEAVELAEKSVIERDAALLREQTLVQHLSALEAASQRQTQVETDTKKTNSILEKKLRSSEKELHTKTEEVELLENHCRELEFNLNSMEEMEVKLAETQEALHRVLADNEDLEAKLRVAYQKEYQQSQALHTLQLRINSCTCPVLKHKLSFTKAEKKKQVGELQRHVETQLKINQKWEAESERLMQQLQAKSVRSATEIEKLKLRNKQLKSQLKAAEIAAQS